MVSEQVLAHKSILVWSWMLHQAMQSSTLSLFTTSSLLVEHVARIPDGLARFIAAVAIIAYGFQLLMRYPSGRMLKLINTKPDHGCLDCTPRIGISLNSRSSIPHCV